MQRRHSWQHLAWRGGVAAVGNAMMFSGVYPLVPHVVRAWQGGTDGRAHPIRDAFREWGAAMAISALRPAGFLPLPGARGLGPRPIVVLHGYAMNRANFVPLAYRLARAGLGPIVGFEYWTLGRTAAAARRLGWFVDEIRAETGAAQVDLIGHSMGGVVARYYLAFAGGDGVAKNLVTLGSPHHGTDVSAIGVGHVNRELFHGSKLLHRLYNAGPPKQTAVTVICSKADALVPGARQPRLAGADTVMFDDLGHVALLGSRRVADVVIDRVRRP